MAYQPTAIQGWMSDEELVWLYNKATEMESVVEIGSWKGRSTHALLSGCRGPVFAIDHFKGNPDELNGQHKEATERDIFIDFWKNVGHFRNLIVMRMDSVAAARFFAPASVDMIFIDGCHLPEAVTADVQAWLPACRKFLCGHDFGVVKEALKAMNLDCKPEIGTLWSYVP